MNNEYILKEDVLKIIEFFKKQDGSKSLRLLVQNDNDHYLLLLEKMIELMRPAGVGEVVRCEECYLQWDGWCLDTNRPVIDKDFFCGKGKKKTEV